jgi:hypothetical protein
MSIYNPSLLPQVKNNGGIALKGGVPYESNPSPLKSFSNKRSYYFASVFASTVVDGVNVTGSNQNILLPVPYTKGKPIIKRTPSTLTNGSVVLTSGNVDTSLTSSIHPITTYRTRLQHTAFKQGKYQYTTGKFDAGYPDNSQDDFGYDSIAYVDRANPGKLIFLNSKNVNIVSYPSKTG